MRERLEQACGTGEIVTILYRGGTQPGTKRDILPRRVGDDVLQALDLATHETRTFRLDRMEIVPHDAPIPVYVASGDAGRFSSLAQVHEGLQHELSRLGWHTIASDGSIGLHAPTRKGKPSRRATLTLRRARSATRPWAVKAPYRFQRSFKSLDRAARFLLGEAHDHSPQRSIPTDPCDESVVKQTLWPELQHRVETSERPGLWRRIRRALGLGRGT